ncbi:MAG: carboxypeptidase-like regulatory domain-containing protein, partial [bacterium]
MKKKNLFLKVMMLFAVILMIVNANAQQTNSREIYGTISFEGTPIEDVNIQIKGTQKGTKTDSKGTYRLTTTVGDIVIYTHVSFEEIAIVVEDVTSELSFELNEIKNELKEAVVTSRKPVSAVSISDKLHQKIRTGVGDVNPLSLPSRVNYIPGRLILPQYATISEFLQGRFAGGPRNYIFDVDGLVYTEEPPINMADIIELYVLRSGVGTLRWCNSVGIPRGCSVVIVRTLNSPEEIAAKREAEAEKYRNQNYYENDAVAIEDKEAEEDTIELQQKEIFGQITTKGTPMKDVSVRVLGTAKGVVTNANGKYKMEVNIGDEIEYSYVGMHKVFVIIEDITSEVNIDMVSLRNSLDEVLVIAKNSRGEVIKRSKKARKKFSTTRGDIDPDRTGFAVGYIDGTKINFAIYQSITEAIQGKVSGISIDPISGKVYLRGRNSSISQDYPAAWEVDGNFTVEEPIGVNLNEIKEIRLLRGPAATNKYGTLGAGGVIVVKTTMGDYGSDERIRGIRQEFTNQDYY